MNEKFPHGHVDGDREPALKSQSVVMAIGRAGTGNGAGNFLLPETSDVRVEGAGPVVRAPAGAEPYIGQAKRGIEIRGSGDEAVAAAIEYASSVFPDSTFSFAGSGAHGFVLVDETSKAFKIRRTALDYSRCEKEAGALKMLSDAGLAPTFHKLVDAGREYRLDRKAYDYRDGGFGDVEIPRQDSGRELPVIVMDAIDTAPLQTVEPSRLVDGFCRAADLFLRNDIISWDAEVMVNKKNDEVIIIDTGELSQKQLGPDVSPQDKRAHDREILRGVAFDFGLVGRTDAIIAAYEAGGMDAVRDFLSTAIAS